MLSIQLAGGLFRQSLTLHEVRWRDFLIMSDLGQHCTGLSDWAGVVCRPRFKCDGGDPKKRAMKYADDTYVIIPAAN